MYFIDPEHIQGLIKGLAIEDASDKQNLQHGFFPI